MDNRWCDLIELICGETTNINCIVFEMEWVFCQNKTGPPYQIFTNSNSHGSVSCDIHYCCNETVSIIRSQTVGNGSKLYLTLDTPADYYKYDLSKWSCLNIWYSICSQTVGNGWYVYLTFDTPAGYYKY